MHCPVIAKYFSAQREDEGAGLTVVHSRTNDLARGVDGDCVEEHPRGVGDGVVQVDQRAAVPEHRVVHAQLGAAAPHRVARRVDPLRGGVAHPRRALLGCEIWRGWGAESTEAALAVLPALSVLPATTEPNPVAQWSRQNAIATASRRDAGCCVRVRTARCRLAVPTHVSVR